MPKSTLVWQKLFISKILRTVPATKISIETFNIIGKNKKKIKQRKIFHITVDMLFSQDINIVDLPT